MSLDIDPSAAAKHPWLAGLAGSVIALRFAPGAGWLERVGNVVAGTACAAYLAPWGAEWFGATSPSSLAALSFGIGMFGLSVAAAVMQAIREVKWADLITGWLPGRKG